MKKKILLTVLVLLLLVAFLAGTKVLQIVKMVDQGKAFVPPPETVTSAEVQSESWESLLTAVGSVRAVQGVTVAAEVPGKVARIAFTSGALVRAGEVLLQQDAGSEAALLPGAEAAERLALANRRRAEDLFGQKYLSAAERDVAVAAHEQAQAQVATLRATIAKKTIRAPFSGRLGIRQVNLGQILREGEAIVSLQSLDPIFVDASFPQQQLAQLRPGLPVQVSSDTAPGRVWHGTLSTVNPDLDPVTRTVPVQATLANRDEALRPGMFVTLAVVLPQRPVVLTVPVTAVAYAPYSDSVFVIEERQDEKSGQKGLALRQQFVHLGEKRGDFVVVTAGLKAGERVASSGVFKLRNGQAVVIDNTHAPQFQLNPQPANQ